MAVYKCKMCGASIEVKEGQSIVTCEFCDTCQTVHSFDNEKKIAFFKRANALRFKNEFDKASGIYETLVAEFPKEAEAYWGLVLCKYGIEYVDDPKTGAKIPTCHRTIFSSIFDDVDYKNAIKYADSVAKDIYIKEAEVIAKLQKEIIEISSKEDPYDIFICYKETDDRGHRTKDSVMAQDIYKVLTNEGYKVFFARVSLADKIGSQYEPIIFSALRSSKVMIHVTTSEENSEAIWVKNEWSRYLNFIKNGEKKALVPVYKDMDVYDLPDEMENFQGIDYSKLGAEQDLVIGLEKIFRKASRTKKASLKRKDEIDDDADEIFESYMKRGEVFLKSGLLQDAEDAFERASLVYEKSGRAELRKMLIKANCKTFDEFIAVTTSKEFESNPYMKTARLLADEKCKKEIEYLDERFTNLKIDECLDYIKTNLKSNRFGSIREYLEKNGLDDVESKHVKNIFNNKIPAFIKECEKIEDSIALLMIKDIYEFLPDDEKEQEIINDIARQEKIIKKRTFLAEKFDFQNGQEINLSFLINTCETYQKNEEAFEKYPSFFEGYEDKFRVYQKQMLVYLNEICDPIINKTLTIDLKPLLMLTDKIKTEESRAVSRKIRLSIANRNAASRAYVGNDLGAKPLEVDQNLYDTDKKTPTVIGTVIGILSLVITLISIIVGCNGGHY